MKRTDQTGPQSVPPQTSSAQSSARANRRVRPGARRRSRTRGRIEEVAALDWQQYGACRTGDGSVFFAPDLPGEPPSARVHRLVEAKRVCAGCAVQELCRSYALENEEEFGVWGGLSEIERRNLIAERRG